jgi:hypothetical protein
MKPQDVVVALCLAVEPARGYRQIAAALQLSLSEAHSSVGRLQAAGLLNLERRVVQASLLEFLLHGLKYVFPARIGGPSLGIPTGTFAPMFATEFAVGSEPPWVWPTPEGTVRGVELAPLYRTVPLVALAQPQLYELLALIDALRAGRARERNRAAVRLKERLA